MEDCKLFRKIPNYRIQEIMASEFVTKRYFNKNEIIIETGSIINHLIIIESGLVKAEMLDASGKVMKIEDLNEGQMLAPAFLFGPHNRFPVTVSARQNTSTIWIPKVSFIDILQNNREILLNYLDLVAGRSQFLAQRLQMQSFKTIKGKIANYIIAHAANNKCLLEYSHQELADMFGVTRPSLSRALRELHNEEILHVNGRSIEIVNKQGLLDFIS